MTRWTKADLEARGIAVDGLKNVTDQAVGGVQGAMVWHPARAKKPSKMRNRKVTIDGLLFDSKAEAERWRQLGMMEKAGEIQFLRRQTKFDLLVNGKWVSTYIADFTYERYDAKRPEGERWKCVVEDVKGARTGPAWVMFRLKNRMFEAQYGRAIEVYPPPGPRKPRKRRA